MKPGASGWPRAGWSIIRPRRPDDHSYRNRVPPRALGFQLTSLLSVGSRELAHLVSSAQARAENVCIYLAENIRTEGTPLSLAIWVGLWAGAR
jgi:hypothetical protein